MKTIWRLSILAGVFLFIGKTPAQYAIDWHTIDGGGGTSTGDVYAVSGTIGQPDAGETMAGGLYSLTGGFWAIHVIQTPGAPFLSIAVSGPNEVTISWDPDDPGWVLQETWDLIEVSQQTAVWIYSPSGSTNPVVVPATEPVRYYRLVRP